MEKPQSIQIVANTYLLKKFSTIDIYQQDLGKSLIPQGEETIRIIDIFAKKYHTLTNNIILKSGKIGTISFYQDSALNQEIFVLFCGDNV